MDSVEQGRMRLRALAPLALVAITPLSSCDDRHPTAFGSIGAVGVGTTAVVDGVPISLAISPSVSYLLIGDRLQLVANVRDTLSTHLVWRSLQPRVAVVTDRGLVTAIGFGRATVVARLAADTNVVAPATIFVSGVVIP